MYALRMFGTASIGIAIAALGMTACAVAIEGVHSALGEQAAIVSFALLGLGVGCLFAAALVRRPARALASREPEPVAANATLDYTIVIPIFNRPDYLIRLHNCLEERMQRWNACGAGEIVVVDDGSTDETPAIAARICERSQIPMRVVTQPNKGVSGARNRGFWEAKGRIGVVIDSDCLPDEDWLPEMLASVEANAPAIAFATIYSDRVAKFPLEASPAGAPFAGASFAARVADYVALGGNFEGFAGASRDDGDLYLQSRRRGFTIVRAEKARVWHPLRRQDVRSAFRSGLAHRYDNLLVERHGDAALFYMGDWILGGSFVGHYPLSLALYAFALVAVYNAGAAVIGSGALDVFGLSGLLLTIAVVWTAAAVAFAAILRVGGKDRRPYVVAAAAYAFGCVIGRFRGTIATGMAIL